MTEPADRVRDATLDDLAGISAIHNDVVATTNAIYTEIPDTPAYRLAWFEERQARGFPVLVVDDDAGVAGFATFGAFRAWPGFDGTVEHSVHVRADARGQGIGESLLTELVSRASRLGLHLMVATVDAGNEDSIRFHERFGFVEVGRMPEVGRKRGRWLTMVILQRRL